MAQSNLYVSDDGKSFTIERTLTAPRQQVWEAWTTPERFEQWWGPKGWRTSVKSMDVKPGGFLLYGMKCEDPNQGEWYGQTSWGKIVYRKIDEPESIIYEDYFSDENGNINASMPSTIIIVSFEEVVGGTKITSIAKYASKASLDQVLEMGMEEGIRQTWDRLEGLLS